jgi:hypothetical protein
MVTLWIAALLGCGEGWLFSGSETEDDPMNAAGPKDSDTDDTADSDDTDVA